MPPGNWIAIAIPRAVLTSAIGLALLLAPAARAGVYPLSAGESFSDVLASPDALAPKLDPFGNWVVYLDDAETNGLEELWSASLQGGDPIRLSGALLAGDDVHRFEISEDGTFVAFLAEYGTDPRQVYVVPIDGGTPVRVSHDGLGSVSVNRFEISPDSQWILYDALDEATLFRVAVSGGSEVAYTYTNSTSCFQYVDAFEISPDSTIVAFRTSLECPQAEPNRFLYRVPLTSTAATQVAGTGDDGFVGSFGFTRPFSGDPVLVFLFDLDGNGPTELRRNNGVGTTTHSISGTFVADGNVTSFQPVPGGHQVVFRSDREVDQVFRLYVTNAGNDSVDQVPARLHEANPVTPGVRELYAVAPAGDRAVWVLDDNPVGGLPFEQLRSAAIASPGSSVLLDEPSVEDATFLRLELAAGAARAVYLVDRDELLRFELFSVPLAGGAPARLNPTANNILTTWDVTDFAIPPDGSRVHFVQDSEVFFNATHSAELRSSPVAGGGSIGLGPIVDRAASESFDGVWAPLRADWAVSLNDSQDTGVRRLTLSDSCLFCDAFEGTGDGLSRWADTLP